MAMAAWEACSGGWESWNRLSIWVKTAQNQEAEWHIKI